MNQRPTTPPFSIARPEVGDAVLRRLDRVAGDDAVLRLVCDVVKRPLELLEALAADAPAALGDDFFAAERLRALLHLAAPWRALPAEAAQLAGSGPKAEPYQPGVLHAGKLVIVALAAIRVAPLRAAGEFLAVIHGLALALSPLEVLGRLEPGGPDGASLATLLRTLVGLGDVGGRPAPSTLRPFGLDPIERGRWSSLVELFGSDALGHFVRDRLEAEKSGTTPWDGASADAIASVEPASARAGARITLRGEFEAGAAKNKDIEAPRVVFAGPVGALLPAEVTRRTKAQLTVIVPAGAESGWIGFSDAARLAASNAYRRGVREFWERLKLSNLPSRPAGFLACLREAPVPSELVADLGRDAVGDEKLAMPPRTAHNRFTLSAGHTIRAIGRATTDGEPDGSETAQILVSQGTFDAPFVAAMPLTVRVVLAAPSTDDTLVLLVVEGEQKARTFTARPEPGSSSVDFDVPADLVTEGSLEVSAYLGPPGEEFPPGIASTTTRVVPARIRDVQAEQAGRAAPFIAGEAVDVMLSFGTALDDVEAVLGFADGTRVAPKISTDGIARFHVPGARVQPGELAFVAALMLIDTVTGIVLVQPVAGTRALDARRVAFPVIEVPFTIGEITATQSGRDAPFAAGRAIDVVVKVAPPGARVELIVAGFEQEPLAASTDESTRATFRVPESFVVAGTLAFEVQLRASDDPEAPIRARQRKQYPVFVELPADVVLFRPYVLRPSSSATTALADRELSRVSDAQRDELFEELGRALALDIQFHELPWIDDTLAVLASDLVDPEDPRVPLLLEGLSRTAALTPGLEGAIWVVLVPSPPERPDALRLHRAAQRVNRGLAAQRPAEAALAVAVCDAVGLRSVLVASAGRQSPSPSQVLSLIMAGGATLTAANAPLALAAPSPTPRAATPRLRLLGERTPDGVELAPAREEERLAGPGAPYATGLVAVTLDANGRVLNELAIHAVREGKNASFELLLPVSPDVQSVEVREHGQVLSELRRPGGRPSISAFGVDTGAPVLHWTYQHTKLARPELQIELIDDTATQAFSVDSCAVDYRIPAHRLPSGRELRVRLVASDGWNKAVSPEEAIAPPEFTLILRRVTANTWFADTNLSGRFEWTLDGQPLTGSGAAPIDGRVIELDATARGVLAVRSLEQGGGISDARVLEGAADA
jgi:hypothetical protein